MPDAKKADQFLPPTHATIDELSRLVLTNIKKSNSLRTWFSKLHSDATGEIIDIDRVVSRHDDQRLAQYMITLPNGNHYVFDGDLDTHDTISELRIDEIIEGENFEDGDLLE